MCCIDAFNVKRRICFGITQALRLFQDNIKVQALLAHFGQDEIGGAIDDARHPLNAVGRETFAQGFDNGNTTRNSGFKRHHHTFGLSRRKNFCAVNRQQCFVGCDHMFASRNGFHDQGLGNAIAANQFHHNVDVGVGNDLSCVADHFDICTTHGLGFGNIQISHHGDFDGSASTTLDFRLISIQHIESATAHCTHA